MRKTWSAIFFCLILLFPLAACANQLIIEPDMGRKPIIEMIKHTKHSLNLVIYGITDKTLLNALIQLKKHGKTLKVILEDEPYKAKSQNKRAISALRLNGISWQGNIPPYRLIHQKSMITDSNKALVMTFNFTHSAFKTQRNFALLIDDKKQVNAINDIFISDWNHRPAAKTLPEFILSPDNSRARLTQLLKLAKHSIDIYAQGVNDYHFNGELAKVAKRHVKVRILTSANTHGKQYNFLRKSGITIKQSKQLYIHAKAFIIDNKTAVIGSHNLTKAAFDHNRELSVITHEINVIEQLHNVFEHDWKKTDLVQFRPKSSRNRRRSS